VPLVVLAGLLVPAAANATAKAPRFPTPHPPHSVATQCPEAPCRSFSFFGGVGGGGVATQCPELQSAWLI
jgi:hypothetical protein